MNIPKDPVMRLSYVNTQLRDNYSSLDDFCQSLNADKTDIVESLKQSANCNITDIELFGKVNVSTLYPAISCLQYLQIPSL